MRVNLSHVLKEIEKQIDSSRNLIAKIKDLGASRIQVEIIAELAFLRTFMAWENFLEESFVRYLIGAQSLSGYKPKRFVNPPNIEIAKKLILGENREYVKWNSSSEVIARVRIYFKDGEPYVDRLERIVTELDEMNTIRNRIAHKSNISKEKFNNFIRRKLGHGIKGMTPGRFLLSSTQPGIPDTFFDCYVEIIKTTSEMIVQ